MALPVPPVDAAYHNKPVPVAVSAAEPVPWQYTTGLVTTGAGVDGSMFTLITALGPSQPFIVWVT